MSDDIAFTCKICGKEHIELPALGCRRPAAFIAARNAGCENIRETDDICVIDGQTFLVRAVLDLPIIGHTTTMQYGPWGSLSEQSFAKYMKTNDDPDQSKIGVMFSYLNNELPGYPGCLGLHCNLVPQDNHQRPQLVLHTKQDHPLVHDQINGITLDRAIELVTQALHPRED